MDKRSTPWVLLCTHRPMYSSAMKQGSNVGLRDLLEPLMVQYGVQLAFSGHDHSYVRAVAPRAIALVLRP